MKKKSCFLFILKSGCEYSKKNLNEVKVAAFWLEKLLLIGEFKEGRNNLIEWLFNSHLEGEG